MRDGAEDAVLVGDVIDLLRFDELLLLHDLHAGVLPRGLLLYQPDASERTCIMRGVPSPSTVRYSKSLTATYSLPGFSPFFYIIIF